MTSHQVNYDFLSFLYSTILFHLSEGNIKVVLWRPTCEGHSSEGNDDAPFPAAFPLDDLNIFFIYNNVEVWTVDWTKQTYILYMYSVISLFSSFLQTKHSHTLINGENDQQMNLDEDNY